MRVTVAELKWRVTEIGFYHLTRTGPDQALPALLGRTLAAGERAVVLCGSPERVEALDRLLWECQGAGLAAAWQRADRARRAAADLADRRPRSGRTGRASCSCSTGPSAADLAAWTRVFDLFDGHDPAAVAAARQRWTAAKAAGHALTYWQQGERGWKKA